MKIKISEIKIKGNNSRRDIGKIEDLANSISKFGLINNISVRSIKDTNYKYGLIDGYRRMKAYEILGLKEIEADIKEVSDENVKFTIY